MSLLDWRLALGEVIAGTANATILCIGDSLTAGCASTGNQMGSNARSGSYPAQLAAGFSAAPASNASWFGDANAPGDGKTLPQYDSRIAMGSGWTYNTADPTVGHNQLNQQSSQTTALTFTPGVEFDRIRVFYGYWTGSPEYTVNIGAGTLATLDMNRASGSEIVYEDVSCALGTNPVNIVATGDWGAISGAYVYKSSVKQVTVINGGWWGVTSTQYADSSAAWAPMSILDTINPDLTIVMLGGNDCLYAVAENTLKNNLRAIVDAAKAVGDVLMVGFTRVNPTIVSEATQTTYIQYIADVATEKGVEFFDPTTRTNWTSYAAANAAGFKDADGIHNTATGYADLAAALLEIIDMQVAVPAADVSAGAWAPSSGSDLYAMLDETPASDADYVTTGAASVFEVEIGAFDDPDVNTGHIFRYRLSGRNGCGFVVSLMQGSTTIASWTHTPASMPTGPATFEQTLTTGQAASISYPATLKFRFEATT